MGCSAGDTTDAGSDAGGDAPSCGGKGTRVGAASDFALGTWTLHGAVIVAQDSGGLFAFSAICTHLGFTVNPPDAKGTTICPCHGSEFDGEGNVLLGPASTSLQHFVVAICNGDVYVNTSKFVSTSTRTPVA